MAGGGDRGENVPMARGTSSLLAALAVAVAGCSGSGTIVGPTGKARPGLGASPPSGGEATTVAVPRREIGVTWAWFLQGGRIPDVDVDIVDVDLFDTPASEIRRMEDAGIKTVCYFSAGTHEDWRPDASWFPDEVLGRAWDVWGERFVDIRRLDLLGPILRARLDLCVAKGFWGVEPDNIDTFGEDTGFPLTARDAVAFARWIAEEAHARGLKVAQKNAPDLAEQLVGWFDFAITEECLADGWCADMAPYRADGKPILDAEYADRGSLDAAICVQAEELGVSVLLADRELTTNLGRCG